MHFLQPALCAHPFPSFIGAKASKKMSGLGNLLGAYGSEDEDEEQEEEQQAAGEHLVVAF